MWFTYYFTIAFPGGLSETLIEMSSDLGEVASRLINQTMDDLLKLDPAILDRLPVNASTIDQVMNPDSFNQDPPD